MLDRVFGQLTARHPADATKDLALSAKVCTHETGLNKSSARPLP
jgi:hypothetical protein